MNRQSLRFGLSLAISFQVAFGPVSVALAKSSASRTAQGPHQVPPQTVKFRLNQSGTYDLYVPDLQTGSYTQVNLGRERITSYNQFSIDGMTRFELYNPSTKKTRTARIVSLSDLKGEVQSTLVKKIRQNGAENITDLREKFSPNAIIITDSGSTYLVNRPLNKAVSRLENLRFDLRSPGKASIYSRSLKALARWSPLAAKAAERIEVKGLERTLSPQTNSPEAKKARRDNIIESVGKSKPGAIMHTVVTISALSVIGLVLAKIKEARLQGKNVDMIELAKLSQESALQVANDPDIYMGMIGSKITERMGHFSGLNQTMAKGIHKTFLGNPPKNATAAAEAAAQAKLNAAMKTPRAIFSKILTNRPARELFAKFLGSVAHSTISFLGWEFGGELWEEAKEMLDSPEEQHAASGLFTLLARSMTGSNTGAPTCSESITPEAAKSITIPEGMTTSPPADQMERTDAQMNAGPTLEKETCVPADPKLAFSRMVLAKMTSNMLKILAYDEELRTYLFYNTWRNRLATGDFATLIASMAAGGVIGSAIFPGAGTIAGIGFGIAGGLISTALPVPLKDGITLGFKNGRANWNEAMMIIDATVLQAKLNPENRMGPILTKITEWKTTAQTNAGMYIYAQKTFFEALWEGLKAGPHIGAITAWLKLKELFRPGLKEQMREQLTPTIDTMLDDRRNQRENLLTAYFEAVHLLKLRITEADQENKIIEQTLEERKKNPEFNSYLNRTGRFLKNTMMLASPIGLAYIGATGFQALKPLKMIVEDNKKHIEICTEGLMVFLKRIHKFYSKEIQTLNRVENESNIPPEVLQVIQSSFLASNEKLELLNDYLKNWTKLAATANFSQPVEQVVVGGMMKSQLESSGPTSLTPDIQNASNALEQMNKHGFREGVLVQTINDALLQGIGIFGKDLSFESAMDEIMKGGSKTLDEDIQLIATPVEEEPLTADAQ